MKIKFKSSLGNFDVNVSTAMEPNLITEELTKTDLLAVEKLIDSKFKKASIESQIREVVLKELGGKENEKRITDIVKNCLVQLYKQLWMKRTAWISGITNSPN